MKRGVLQQLSMILFLHVASVLSSLAFVVFQDHFHVLGNPLNYFTSWSTPFTLEVQRSIPHVVFLCLSLRESSCLNNNTSSCPSCVCGSLGWRGSVPTSTNNTLQKITKAEREISLQVLLSS
eukprot:c30138_g1_i1 orf=142-507(-)